MHHLNIETNPTADWGWGEEGGGEGGLKNK